MRQLSIEKNRQTPAPRRRFSGAGDDAGKPMKCLCGKPAAVKNRCLKCTEILIEFVSGAKMKAAETHLKHKRSEVEAGAIKAGMLLILAKLSTQ